MLIASEMKARLNADADRIATAMQVQLNAYGTTLLDIQAHMQGEGSRTAEEFRAYTERLDLPSRFPGLGALALVRRGPSGTRLESLISFDPRATALLKGNLLSSTGLLRAQNEASDSGDLAIRIVPASERTTNHGTLSLILALPSPRGLFLLAPVDLRNFFDGTFGSPSLRQEAVNFVLGASPEASNLYNRFGMNEADVRPWAATERIVPLHGRELQLRVYPLENFYSFADRYLALIVGLGAALLSCLIMVVMRVSQGQLELEILAKEASIEAALQSRRQVENLRRLNEFDRSLAGELDTDSLVQKFFSSLSQLTQVDASFLYLAKRGLNPKNFQFCGSDGMPVPTLPASVPVSVVEVMSGRRPLVRKGQPGAKEALALFLGDASALSDWLLMPIFTRETGKRGLVLVARKNGARFSEVDRELFESMISQFASSIEIALLFERVEDASRAKNAFLANMSHEIRTPLGAIVGFSEMLSQEDIAGSQKQEIAGNIRKNGEQLTCIIDDILDLSKVEAGKLRIEKRKVRLASLVHEIKTVMELRAKDKGVDFSVESSGSLPSHIHTDEVRLKQILMNIVGNALKFTEHGSVKLIARALPTDARMGVVVFTIKDTGVGISDEAQAELFSPFSQGDNSSTRRFGGSGLGLALSKRLAQELGGDVTLLNSIRGEGSTFEVRVAAGDVSQVAWHERLFRQAPAQVEEKNVGPAANLAGARILVVEDSEDNQEIFRYFLESSGAQTEIVDNGLQAVKSADTGSYDMILMDIQIPGIDGKEATRRIRQHGFSKPIVALTAHAMLEERESCMRAGCNGQITKPVSGEVLVSRIAEYLGRA